MIEVSGQLLSPMNLPIGEATIRLTALVSTGETPTSSNAVHTTDAQGNYSFMVPFGRYRLEVDAVDSFELVAEVIADAATPTPIGLINWTDYATPVTPPVIAPDNPDWNQLHETVRTGEERDKIDQLSDNTTLTNETKRLYINDTAQANMAEEDVVTSVGSVRVATQTTAYNDAVNNESLQHAVIGATTDTTMKDSLEVYEASNGTTQLVSERTLTSPDATISVTTKSDGSDLTHEERYVTGAVGFTETAKTENNKTTLTREDTTYIDGISLKNFDILASAYTDSLGRPLDKPRLNMGSSVDFVSGVHNATITDDCTALLTYDDEISVNKLWGAKVYNRDTFLDITNTGFKGTTTLQTDLFSIQGTNGAELVEMDADANVVTVRGRLVVTNAADFQGPPGETIFEVFKYAATDPSNPPDGPNWHDEFVPGDKWRIFNKSVNGYIDPNTWSTPVNLDAEDGLPGDTLYFQYQYSLDKFLWHDEMEDDDIWRRERIIENGVPTGPWSAPARIRGFNGEDADLTEIEYSYAVDGLAPDNAWHYNFTTGDHFRRDRIIYFANIQDRDDYVPGSNDTFYKATPWLNITQIVPIDGVDYGSKQTTIFIFQRGATEPAPPLDLTYNFSTLELQPAANRNGWTQTMPAGTDNLYMGIATATTIGTTDLIGSGEWNINQMGAGTFNQANVTLYIRDGSGTPPTPPSTILTFDFAANDFVAPFDLEGWSRTIPAGSDTLYFASGAAFGAGATDTIHPTEWQVAEQGATGLNQANIIIFQRTNNSTTAPAAPTSDMNYNFTTGDLTGLTNGWLEAIPEGAGTLWVGTAVALSYGTNDTIPPAEWNIGKLAEDGRTASTANLFCISDTQPAVAFATATRNLLTGDIAIVGPNTEGWQNSPPDNSASGGKMWHISDVRLATSTDTVTIHPAADFSVPIVYSQNGTDGVDGKDGYIIRGFYRSAATRPLKPTGTDLANPTPGWSEDAPDAKPDEIIWASYTYAASEAATTGSGIWTEVAQWSGDAVWYTYQYSKFGTTSWHSDFETGDIYRREAIVTNGVVGTWSAASRITGFDGTDGSDGIDGKDGSFHSYVYKVSAASSVSPPVGGSFDGTNESFPSGWSDDPIWSDGKTTYVSYRRYTNNGTNWVGSTWTAPAVFARQGDDGVDGRIIRAVYKLSATTPAKPTGTTIPPAGWLDDAPTTIPEGQVIWACYTYADDATTTTGSGFWTAVGHWSGNAGTNGTNGKHGQGSFRVEKTSVPVDSVKDSDIAAIANRPAQEGDLINYFWETGADAYSRYFYRGANTYTEASFVVNGSAVIEGTLAASTLRSGDVFTQKLHVGQNSLSQSEMTLAGNGDSNNPEGRLWLGHTLYSSAPFRVDKDGNVRANRLTATGATINGAITATKLTFVSSSAIPDEIDNANSDPKGSAAQAEQNAASDATTKANKAEQDAITASRTGTNVMPVKYTQLNKNNFPPLGSKGGASGGSAEWRQYTVGGSSRGIGSIRIQSGSGGEFYTYLSETSVKYNIALRPSTKWILSCWVYSNSSTDRRCTLYLKDSAGKHYAVSRTVPKGVWTRVSGVVDLTASTVSSGVFRVDTDNPNTEMYFAEWMVEEALDGQTTPAQQNNAGAVYPSQDKLQISSDNYEKGVRGWGIDADGDCEFNNGVFRGTLEGADGNFSGTISADNIIGDLVAAKAYTSGALPANDTWGEVLRITVTNNNSADSTVSISGLIGTAVAGGPNGDSYATAAFETHRGTSRTDLIAGSAGYNISFQGSYLNNPYTGWNAIATGVEAIDTLAVGATQTYTIWAKLRGGSRNLPGSRVVARLFRNGSAFS